MDARELKQRLDEDRDLVLLDVLPQEAFDEMHLPGARHACVYEVGFLDQVARHVPAKDTEIVVYCSGPDSRASADAVDRLAAAGYENVAAFAGGREEWQEAGLPLEGERAGEPWVADPAPPLADGTYAADPQRSVVVWTGRNPGGAHWGTLRLKEGSVQVRDGRLEGGEFQLDLTTIEVGDLEGEPARTLVAHLFSDDFFAVERHPVARLEIAAAVPIEEATPGTPNVAVEGSLELRGERRNLRFPAAVRPKEDGLALDAHFDFDRTRWGVNYGSGKLYHRLGMHLVDDAITLDVRVFARRTE